MCAVISAPLILGLDLTKREVLESIVPIVTNKEALAVNQQWAGHPGALVKQWAPSGQPLPLGDNVSNGGSVTQLWAKPQPGGKVAALVINNSPSPATVSIELAALNISAGGAAPTLERAMQLPALPRSLVAPLGSCGRLSLLSLSAPPPSHLRRLGALLALLPNLSYPEAEPQLLLARGESVEERRPSWFGSLREAAPTA